MVAGLGAEFYLAQPAVSASGCLVDGLGEELRIHKMGAGTGGKKTAVLYQPYSPQVDLTVTFYSVLNGTAGLRKSGGIQNHNIKQFSGFF